jgi:2'-5' RNA ligase
MGCDSNGMPGSLLPGDEWLNVFALVIYIPDPLGGFLDDLRRDLVPGCNPHAHVSVLPPREITDSWKPAMEQARALLETWTPFEVEATNLNLFPATDVVYVEVGAGAQELRRLHAAMNSELLSFTERFAYHPHITLAQEIPEGRVQEVYQRALRRWEEYDGPRKFIADRAVFVRNTVANRWGDLAAFSLGTVGVPRA